MIARHQKARTAYKSLPQKGGQVDKSEANKMEVPAKIVVRFKPAKELKATAAKLKSVPKTATKEEAEIV